MNGFNEREFAVNSKDYDTHFWNSMRDRHIDYNEIAKGKIALIDTFALPAAAMKKFEKQLEQESFFRRLATVINAYQSGNKIIAKDCKDTAEWVEEGGVIPVYNGISDFSSKSVETHKLAGIVKLDEDFVYDSTFDIQGYLISRFARTIGKAEEKAFISGTGLKEPTGILDDINGADVAFETANLNYDDIVKLYFSLDDEYRKNAVWLMNDETALVLRTLKDASGNYIWNQADDTILGKPVHISNYMPTAELGAKPVVIGDFSYYWIVNRRKLSMRMLTEKFASLNQIGYLGIEYLDGKLIRNEAVKSLKISDKT